MYSASHIHVHIEKLPHFDTTRLARSRSTRYLLSIKNLTTSLCDKGVGVGVGRGGVVCTLQGCGCGEGGGGCALYRVVCYLLILSVWCR